jgi:transposase
MRTKATIQELEARRRVAAKLLRRKLGVNRVAKLVDAAPSSVSRWAKTLRKGGLRALSAKPNRGAKPRLSGGERQRLIRILRCGPLQAGYPTDMWTCRRVAEVIGRNFGVWYHPGHVWHLLSKWGWSCQKPEQLARERRERAIARWRTEEWPRIKKGGTVAS